MVYVFSFLPCRKDNIPELEPLLALVLIYEVMYTNTGVGSSVGKGITKKFLWLVHLRSLSWPIPKGWVLIQIPHDM